MWSDQLLRSKPCGCVASSTDGRRTQQTRPRVGSGAGWWTTRLDVLRGRSGTFGVAAGGGRTVGLGESPTTELDDARQFLATLRVNALAQHTNLAVQRSCLDEHIFESPQRQFRRRVQSVSVAGAQRARRRRRWGDRGRLDRVCSRGRYDGNSLRLQQLRWRVAVDIGNRSSASDWNAADVVLLHCTNFGYRYRYWCWCRCWRRFRFRFRYWFWHRFPFPSPFWFFGYDVDYLTHTHTLFSRTRINDSLHVVNIAALVFYAKSSVGRGITKWWPMSVRPYVCRSVCHVSRPNSRT